MNLFAKHGLFIALLGIILFLSSCAGSHYVNNIPNEPNDNKSSIPYAGAIWIPGDWIWVKGHYKTDMKAIVENGQVEGFMGVKGAWQPAEYVFIEGHWDKPRPGHVYIPGLWTHRTQGYMWKKGYWK